MSLRGSIDELATDECMGTFNSSTFDHYDRSAFETEGFRWNEAHRARDAAAGYMELKGKDDGVGLLKYIKNYEKFCWSKVGKPRAAGFEINNIGTFEEGKKEEVEDRIEERRARSGKWEE